VSFPGASRVGNEAVSALAGEIRALTQQVETLRAELEQYRTDLRDALDRLPDQYPTLWGATTGSQPRPRPRH
jgi:ABC-type transporter Mla subunit MlaD